MNHKKKILIIVLFLQSWIFFSFLLITNIQSENSNPITTNLFLKSSSKKVIVRILDEIQVNYNITDDQRVPSICKLSEDTFAVAWNSYGQDGSSFGVYASVFNATTGNNITSEFRVNHYTKYSQSGSSICKLSEDTFAVAWQSDGQDGSDYGVYARVFDATTGKNITSEFQVNNYKGADQLNPSVCALSSDILAVAWDSLGQDGSGEGVYARVFNATTGNNITSEFRVNQETNLGQARPSICTLSNDTLAVAWESFQDGSLYGIYARVFNATTGKSITSEFQVNHYWGGFQIYPSICSISNDTFAVTWQSSGQDGSGEGVYARVFNATTGNNLTSEFRVNHYTKNDQSWPSVYALSNDTFAITWSSNGQDGSGEGVYARVFDASTGNNIIPEFQVNQYTENDQLWPSVCALSNDTFAIAWSSNGQDGDQDGIYCSIFRIENYYPSNSLPFGPVDGNDDDDDNDDDDSIPFGSLYFAIFLISVLSLVLITRYQILKKGGRK